MLGRSLWTAVHFIKTRANVQAIVMHMARTHCPHCQSDQLARNSANRLRCKVCRRTFYATARPKARQPLIYHCPRCGPTDHTRAGSVGGRRKACCKTCGHIHFIEGRTRKPILNNHPRPRCPACGDASVSRRGIDWTYEKQAYACRSCAHTFKVRLTRFLPIDQLDTMLDEAILFARHFAGVLTLCGTFPDRAGKPERRFAALLAGEIYSAQIGQAPHSTIADAVSAAVVTFNRAFSHHQCGSEVVGTPIRLAPILVALASTPAPAIAPRYTLDRTLATAGIPADRAPSSTDRRP